MPTWTYSINGGTPQSATADPSAPGALVLVSRSQHNQQAGEVTLRKLLRSPSEQPVFAEWQDVKIFRNGVLWFAGKAQDPVEDMGPQGTSLVYTIVDHWRTLEETYFRIQNGPPWPSIPIINSTIEIFWNWVQTNFWNPYMTGVCQVQAWPASMTGFPITSKPFDNTHFADQARSMLKWYLHSAVCWDYTGLDGIPVLRLRATGDRVVTLTRGAPPVSSIAVTAGGQLAPLGVETRFSNNPSPFEFSTQITDSPDNEGIYPPTLVRGAPGVLTLFVPSNTPETEYYMSGQSEFIFRTLTQSIYRGQIVLKARDCDSGIQPGDTINILNSRPEHATMQAMVQSVTETLATGETTISVGATGDDSAQTIGQKYNEWTRGGQWKSPKFVPFA